MVIKNYVIKPPEDTIKSENDLKPCPFCGGEAELTGRYIKGGANNYQYFIRCKRCKARPQAYNTFRKSERAIEEWNRREPEEEQEKEISTTLYTWLSSCFFAAIILSCLKLRQAFWGICLAESLVIPSLLIGYFLDKRRKRKK